MTAHTGEGGRCLDAAVVHVLLHGPLLSTADPHRHDFHTGCCLDSAGWKKDTCPLQLKTGSKNGSLGQRSPLLWKMQGTPAVSVFPLKTKCPMIFTGSQRWATRTHFLFISALGNGSLSASRPPVLGVTDVSGQEGQHLRACSSPGGGEGPREVERRGGCGSLADCPIQGTEEEAAVNTPGEGTWGPCRPPEKKHSLQAKQGGQVLPGARSAELSSPRKNARTPVQG